MAKTPDPPSSESILGRFPLLDNERDDSFRAIGRYFAQFSGLILFMRHLMVEKIVGSDKQAIVLLQLALGSLQAQQIADGFFAICRTAASPELNKTELAIEKCLRESHVNAEIRFRNVLAHGDWVVPDADFRTGVLDGSAGPLDYKALLLRVHPHKVDSFDVQEWAPQEIDAFGRRVEGLQHLIMEFGSVCLRVGSHEPNCPPFGSQNLRVEDILELTGSANNGRVRFKRDYWAALAEEGRARRS